MMISSNNDLSYFNTYIPQPQPLQPQSARPIEPMFSMLQSNPPFHHSPGAPYSVTFVDQMTVDQTATWIWTLGGYKGWAEAETYAEIFRENSISGEVLEEITEEMLEFSLGITNPTHRLELLSTIQHLFPNRYVPELPKSITGIEILESPHHTSHDGELSSMGSDCESYYESTGVCRSAQVEFDMMSESGYSRQSTASSYIGNNHYVEVGGLSNSIVNRVRKDNLGKKEDVVMSDRSAPGGGTYRPMKFRKLLLTLRPDRIIQNECPIKRIYSRFEHLNIVEVLPMKKRPNTYIIVFPHYTQAEEALSQANDIGYVLKKKWPPRPNPNRPLQYKSLASQKIRTGKSLSGKIVGRLEKGETVTVNQIKGRRARLIEKENGEIVTIGWVSLHEPDGLTLLTQLGDF